MKSKELNEILNETRRTPNISLTPEQVEEIINKLEILEILKPFLKRSLHIEKIDLTKEENKIYNGYLSKDYNKKYIYKWDYNYSIWDVFKNEENAIKLKEWLDNE